MPPLPPVSGLVRLLIQYTLPGVTNALTRLFFQGTGSTTNSALNSWCSSVGTNWAANMAGTAGSQLTAIGATAEDLTSTTAPVGSASFSHAGSVSGAEIEPAVCFVMRNHTDLRERGGHSRSYLPGVATTQLSAAGANTWSTSAQTNIPTSWSTFIGSISGSNGPTGYSNFVQVMPNYYKGFTSVQNPITHRWRNIPTPLATPVIYVVTAYSANPQVGSQRRRNKQTS